jgi:ribosomal protein S16
MRRGMREPIPVRIIKPIYHNTVSNAREEKEVAHISAIGNYE